MGPKQAAKVPEAPWVHLWLWLSPQPWKLGFTTYLGVQQESSAHNLRDSEKGCNLPGITQHSSAQTGRPGVELGSTFKDIGGGHWLPGLLAWGGGPGLWPHRMQFLGLRPT